MAVSLRRVLGLVVVVLAAGRTTAHAQTGSVELDLTGGYSGEEVRGAATQLRVFGEVNRQSKLQYFAEVAWGQRWSDGAVVGTPLIGADPLGSDVFGAAYSYRKKVQLIEGYVERSFQTGRAMFVARGGQFRTPFGIYDRSDYAYTGFIRPPLIRYDGYFGLSNTYTERGAQVLAGLPQLFVEGSLGRPHDLGSSQRRPGLDESVRVQAYRGRFIVGVSHARSEPYLPALFAVGRQRFTGTDVRWSHPAGIQVRGEFFHGHSFTGVTTNGWYVDGLMHHVGMGPFTGVVRAEAMEYTAPAPRARSAHRVTLGTRLRLPGFVTLQLNYVQQRGDLPRIYDKSIDFTLTYSIRYH